MPRPGVHPPIGFRRLRSCPPARGLRPLQEAGDYSTDLSLKCETNFGRVDREAQDWAEAARLAGVTRGRMTQIANLLLLAPRIQEGILDLPNVTRGSDPVTERSLREVAAHADWQSQEVPCLRPKG